MDFMLRMIHEALVAGTPQVEQLLRVLAVGLTEMTLPEKPNSPLQRYRLTGLFSQDPVVGSTLYGSG
jgi:hypothetical protein